MAIILRKTRLYKQGNARGILLLAVLPRHGTSLPCLASDSQVALGDDSELVHSYICVRLVAALHCGPHPDGINLHLQRQPVLPANGVQNSNDANVVIVGQSSSNL